MIHDILTLMRKEWREIILQRATARTGILASLVVPLAVLGVLMPAKQGPQWVSSAMAPLLWIWFPVFLVATMICDAFAGERERHTLETLLATRLSDDVILVGKIAAAVGYGWGLTLAGITLGLITVNVFHGRGRLLMFPTDVLLAVIGLSLLGSVMAAGGGILISLRATTVRQAQQTLSLALMVLAFGVGGAVQALPPEARHWLAQFLAGATLVRIELTAAAVLILIDLVLLAAARARFRRTQLVLD